MKRLIGICLLVMSCAPPDFIPPVPGVPSFGKVDGGAVQSISSKLTLDARVFIKVRLQYDQDWDGILGGVTSTATLYRSEYPASQLTCPNLWIWVSHDPSGSATWAFEQGYSMAATQTSLVQSTIPNGGTPGTTGRWYYRNWCDYVFREGGGEIWRSGIPVQSGDNWVGFGVQCPGATTGPTALTNVIKITVPPNTANVYWVATVDGPFRNKALWQPVATTGCAGWSADPGWYSTTTLSASWCSQFTPAQCSPSSGNIVRMERSW